MAWYTAEIQRYPRSELGWNAKSGMSIQVVCLQTNEREYVRLVLEMFGHERCDVHTSPSGESLTVYVAPTPGGSLLEVRRAIHCRLREQLLSAKLPGEVSG